MGYSQPVIRRPFPDLTDDLAGDPIWVTIKNPKIMPPDSLRPREIPTDSEGRPVNETDALMAMYEILAGLVIGWRVYDATQISLDEMGNAAPMVLLPAVSKDAPATAAMVRCLPMTIINDLADQVKQAANPSP